MRPFPIALFAALLLRAGVVLADHAPASFGTTHSGALTTLSAATQPAGALSLGLQLQVLDFTRFSDAELVGHAEAGEHVHGLGSLYQGSLSLAYGLTENLTVIASLPHVTRRAQREAEHDHADGHDHGAGLPLPLPGIPHEHEESAPVVRRLDDSAGLGDLTLLGQYRWRRDPAAAQLAWLFGFKAPTGRTDLRDNDGRRLETHHQPGTGAWDALSGIAASAPWLAGALDASLLYTHTGEGSQDTRMGRSLAYNLAYSRRLGQRAEPSHSHAHGHAQHQDHPEAGATATPLKWSFALELNGEWHDRERRAGTTQEHTGGHLLYLAPGLRAGVGAWSAGFSFGVPVVKDLNGVQSEPDYRLLLSLGTTL